MFSGVSSGSELFTGETNNQRANTAGVVSAKDIKKETLWSTYVECLYPQGRDLINSVYFSLKLAFEMIN